MVTGKTVGLRSGARIEMEADWRFCRVLRGGTRALREAGIEFTPKTAREREDGQVYTERLASSTLYDVYGETIARIASLPFQKPPVIAGIEELPEQVAKMADDADRAGTSLSVFAATIYQDAIDRGIGLFLVDNVPVQPGTTQTQADAIDARPYLSRIDPDNLVGFRSEMRFGREVCVELRVREWIYETNQATGIDELVEMIRAYTGESVSVWKRNLGRAAMTDTRETAASTPGDRTEFTLAVPPTPTFFPGGEIPVVVVYTKQIGFMHGKPPLLELAHLNLKHWNQQSILDSSIRYCGHPLLFGRGFTAEEREARPKTGEGARILVQSETAQLSFVEIAGTSIAAQREEVAKTEARMRASATDPLQKSSATATGEVRSEMRDQSEAQKWIEALEWSFYRAFVIACQWIGEPVPEGFNISFHRTSSLLQVANPQRTLALKADVDAGLITPETYLKERARSGDFADDFDPNAEAEAVAMQKERSQQAQMDAMVAQLKAAEAQQPGEQSADDSQNDQQPTAA